MIYSSFVKSILVCPETGNKLQPVENGFKRPDGKTYKIMDGILSIVYPQDISGSDKKMNAFYNMLAPLYDINEQIMGKIIAGINMIEGRKDIVNYLNLRPGMKILEVSPGPGVFQKFLRNKIGFEGELVSLDLSLGMLWQCQKRNSHLNVQLIHGNAQYLPFAENSFDAVFHFGGVNLFNDPQKAISEFIRVTKDGGIVSWGDEGFAADYPNNLRRKILSKINAGYTKTRQTIPATVFGAKEHEVYNGLGYLVVGKKTNRR
ncbi:MAG: methyltransferase domain-containing protein [Chitinivibrionales bacterium]